MICSSSCGDQVILLAIVDCSGLPQRLIVWWCLSSTIGTKAVANKTTTTKFEVEKFDRKNNFLLWRVTTLLVMEGTHKVLIDAEKKSKMEDDEWMDFNVRAKATIILCISDEVLYNVMNEKTTACL